MSDSSNYLRCSAPVSKPQNIGFLLLDNFTMIALASAVEPLRMANQLSGRELFNWFTISQDGAELSASDGIRIKPDAAMQEVDNIDTLLVVGGVNITQNYTAKQVSWLKSLAAQNVQLGGLCTGGYVLAEAGLLDGYDCSVHWECIASMQETFPKVRCSNHLFTIDRDRLTSSGGTVPLDLMLHIIRRDFGHQLTAAISEMFICDRVRTEVDYQKIPLRHVLGTTQPKLIEVVTLMEANIEETIELDELARYVGLSRRQLERLFQKNLQCTPSKYYMKLRLYKARQLLKQSTLSIIDIAVACGFVSTPHFSKCYREHLGIAPREERRGMSATNTKRASPGNKSTVQKSANHTATKAPGNLSVSALSNAQFEPSYGSVAL